ncbi:hypothetical protein J6590_018136 [Homalodisca vitripennis]|nr:hypothetical protein J6590_018136 [Homalodisca vitripennis]
MGIVTRLAGAGYFDEWTDGHRGGLASTRCRSGAGHSAVALARNCRSTTRRSSAFFVPARRRTAGRASAAIRYHTTVYRHTPACSCP